MRLPVVVLALLLVLPLVHAGTQADPEIVDSPPFLDAAYGALRGDTTLGAPEIDLVAAWFGSNDTTVGVTWQVADGTHRIEANEDLTFGVAFSCGTQLLDIHAQVSSIPGATFGGMSFWDAHVPVTVDGNLIHVDIPRSAFASHSCTLLKNTMAGSLLSIATTDPNARSGGGPLWWRDQAPDVGHGRDFALT